MCAIAPGSRASALHPTIPRARAARLRSRRHLERPRDRRVRLSCCASWRPQLRDSSRSTPMKRKAGAWRDSPAAGIRLPPLTVPPEERNPDFPFTLDLAASSPTQCDGPETPQILVDGIAHDALRSPRRPGACSMGTSRSGLVHDELIDAGRRAPPALRHLRAIARDARPARARVAVGERASARFATTASPTTSTAIREGVDRPWTLDMMPLLDAAGGVEHARGGADAAGAAAQPASRRLYGPQRLLQRTATAAAAGVRQSWLSPAVPRHSGAARHSSPPARRGPRALARRPMVGARRSHAGALGRGYTLENRIVLSRSLPEAFRDCQVQRLASFFRTPARHADGAGARARATRRASCC